MLSPRSLPVIFLFVLSLLAGCRSEQVAFDFSAPVGAGPGAPRTRLVHPLALPAADATDAPASATVQPALPAARFGSTAHPEPRRLRVQRPFALVAAPHAILRLALAVPLRPRHRAGSAIARTQNTAEAGLGRTVLFIVGVVLAVLAGLAALVSLIPGVSFWGGLGLAVGGLLVLYLLYKLFSPKKKA